MTTILTTCSVLLGKRKEFKSVFQTLKNLYINEGAKLVGFWWTLGGEANEAVWMFKWETVSSYLQGKKSIQQNNSYPIEELSSILTSYNEKILQE
jgi:hypothetical protein